MKQLLAAIACAALFGCASEQEPPIDPTAAGSMGAAGSGSVSLPPDRLVVTNPPPPEPFIAPTTGSPTP